MSEDGFSLEIARGSRHGIQTKFGNNPANPLPQATNKGSLQPAGPQASSCKINSSPAALMENWKINPPPLFMLEEGVERVLHKPRRVGTGSGFGLREEGRGVLPQQPVERGLLLWR